MSVKSAKKSPKWHVLAFTIDLQEQSNWCWAAVAQSVAGFFGPAPPPAQCEIASNILGDCFTQPDCCADRAKYNVTYFLASPLASVQHLRAWNVGQIAEFEAVAGEIRAGRPLAARIAYWTGGAHFIVVIGYLTPKVPSLHDHLCHITDPLFGDSLVPYRDLVCGYHSADWTDTYYLAK